MFPIPNSEGTHTPRITEITRLQSENIVAIIHKYEITCDLCNNTITSDIE